MAYTTEDKKAMYESAVSDLAMAAVRLKQFSEDEDLFVDGEPSPEQASAKRSCQQLSEMIGRFSVEAKVNELIT